MSDVMTFRCPNCGSKLEYESKDKSVNCYVCDSLVNVPGVSIGSNGGNTFVGITGMGQSSMDNMTIMPPAFVGFDNPESGVVYVENFFDTYNWEDYQKGIGIDIPEIKKVIDNNKMKNGALALSWYLDYKGLAVPVGKKIEGLDKLQQEIGEAYNPVDASSACSAFDTYNRIVKKLTDEKENIFKRLETAMAYAKKFALDAAKSKEIKADFDALKAAFEEKVVVYEKLAEVPAYQQAKKEVSKQRAAELMEKGINAEEVYNKAVAQYNSSNADKSAALSMFETIRGYEDSVDYIEKINQYFVADGTLYRFFGKHYIYKVEDYTESLNVKQLKKKAKDTNAEEEEGQDMSALSLYEIVDGLPAEEALIKGIDQIIGCYGSRLYYFKRQGIYSYDVYTKQEECINKGKKKDYTNADDKYELSFNSQGNAFFVRKKLSAEEPKGCLKKNKKPEEKLNPYCVLLVDMAKNTCRTLLKEVYTLARHDEDKLFYTVAYKPAKVKSGCFRKAIVPEMKTKLLVCDIVSGESKQILDEDCEIHAVKGNNIVYSLWKPNEYNKDLHICNFKTGEDTLIECNIYRYFDIIGDKLYYTIGNVDYRPLVRCDFDGSNREEIMPNVENIIGERGGWLYVKKGRGRNAVLVKVSGDGKTRQALCTQFKEICRFVDNRVYYVDVYNSLRAVRIDGKENCELAKDVTNVFPSEKGLYYVREESVNEVETALSLYWMDFDGRNVKKIVFNIDYVKTDEATNTLYYSKEEPIRYKVYLPKKEKKAVYETYTINKFYRMDKDTNKSQLILTLGLPDAVKKGCLKKKKKYIYEEAPIKQSYATHSIVVEKKEEGVITPVENTKKPIGCGCLGAPKKTKAKSAGCGCLGSPKKAGKNVNPTKASATQNVTRQRNSRPKSNPIMLLLMLVAFGLFVGAIVTLTKNIDLIRGEAMDGVTPLILLVLSAGVAAFAFLKGVGNEKKGVIAVAALAIVVALTSSIIGFTKIPGKGDTIGEAIVLEMDEEEKVKINQSTKFYKFTTDEAGYYVITLSDSNEVSGVTCQISDSYYASQTFYYYSGTQEQKYYLSANTTYYLMFSSNYEGRVKFKVEVDKDSDSNGGSSNSGSSASDAISLTEGTEKTGGVSYSNGSVWYSFTPTESGKYVVSTTANNSVYLYYYTNPNYSSSSYDYGTDNELAVTLTAGTTYYFKVSYASYPANYTLQVEKANGETAASAIAMTEGSSYSGSVSYNDSAVWYSFTPTESGKYTVSCPTYNSSYLYYYTNPNYSYSSYDYGTENELTVTLTANSTYYFKVQYSSNTTNYTIKVEKVMGTTADSAIAMTEGSSYSGGVSYDNYDVWYSFTPTESGTYAVSTSSNYSVYLYYYTNPNSSYSSYDYGTTNELSVAMTADTTYYFKVSYYSSSTNFTIGIEEAVPGETADSAIELTDSTPYSDYVGYNEVVWYSFTPTKSGKHTITTSSYQNVYLYYYTNPNGAYYSSDSGTNNELSMTLTAGTTYYFKVSYYSSSTNFTIEIARQGGATADDAIEMTQDTSYSGNVSYNDSAVWYSFTPTTTGQYTVTSTATYTTYLYYYIDPNYSYSSSDSGTTNELSVAMTAGSTYYFKVAYYSSSTGYEIVIEENDGETKTKAIAVVEDTSYSGNVSSTNDETWYSFTPTTNGYYTISATSVNTTYLYYYGTSSSYSDYKSGTSMSFNRIYLYSGSTYYFKIEYSYYSSEYTIEVEKTAGATADSAIVITEGSSYSGDVSSSNRSVWYSFTPTESGSYIVSTSSTSRVYLYLYEDPASTYKQYASNASNTLSMIMTAGTTYYFKVEYYSLSTGYTLQVEEPNGETKATAIGLSRGESKSGSVSSSNSTVWYSFTPTITTYYNVNVSSSYSYVYLYYYGTSSSPSSYSGYNPGKTNVYMEVGYTYYFAVGYYSSSTSYTVEVDINGTVVEGATTVEKYVSSGSYSDIFIAPTEDGTWTFTSNTSGDTKATLYNASGTSIAYNDDGNGANFSITEELEAGEVYYLRVQWYSSSKSGYIPVIITVS